MALTEIEYGALASSEVMNNNFNYLDNRINNISETIIANTASNNSNIASINSTISSLTEKLNTDIENLNADLTKTNSEISKSGIYIATYINGNSWYREYFSDTEKKNRVWIEQGGVIWSRGSVTYLKSFQDTNYTLTLGTHNTYYEHGGISGKSETGFSHYDSKGWSYTVEWYACGK